MKKIYSLGLSAVAVALAWQMPMQAYATEIAPGVQAVYPAPDQRVNVGPNDYYLGLQEIAFQYGQPLEVNRDCTGVACIYLQGDQTPIQSVGVEGASVDVMINSRCSVLFPYVCNANGSYTVTIPEGFWYVGEGEARTLSGAMTLDYEIYVPQAVWPAPGTLSELGTITVTFPDFEKAELLDKSLISLYGVGTVDDLAFDVTEGEYANQLDIVLAAPVGKSGDYKLQLLAGAMRGVNADGSSEANSEMIYSWTVAAAGQPVITPAEGEVKEFSSFVLSVPEGAAFWFCDDRSKNYIYEADEEGNLYSDPLCMVKPVADIAAGTITLTVMETTEGKDTLIPADGYYCLVLAKGLYSGSWGDDFINSPELRYYYKVANNYSAVDSLESVDGESADVYNMQGVRVLRSVTADDLRSLPAGIYVYGNRKVVVR
ncbi:MAG: hypothetical protein K2O78_05830 [Muribaculaceae bacterium]|nr:hypothetical protein [Muribaculaceae bacterium]